MSVGCVDNKEDKDTREKAREAEREREGAGIWVNEVSLLTFYQGHDQGERGEPVGKRRCPLRQSKGTPNSTSSVAHIDIDIEHIWSSNGNDTKLVRRNYISLIAV